MLTDDGRDGFDTCAWIAKQAWAEWKSRHDGQRRMSAGRSMPLRWSARRSWQTAIPIDAMSNLGYASMRNGGAFELRFWNWIYSITGPKGSRQSRDPATAAMLKDMMQNRRFYLFNLPLRRGTTPLKFIPEYEDWLVEALARSQRRLLEAKQYLDYADHYKDIPVYLIGGWYDSWGGNTAANFRRSQSKAQRTDLPDHGPLDSRRPGGVPARPGDLRPRAAIPDVLAWQLEWFDHWLKGADNSVGKRAPFATPVRIFVMGSGDGRKTPDGKLNHGGYWREEHEWPLARATSTSFYLHPQGKLSRETPPADGRATSFQFDPAKPVPTIGGNISSGGGILLQGAWDQRGGPHVWNGPEPIPLSARNDIVVFQTEPLNGRLRSHRTDGGEALDLVVRASTPTSPPS